MADPRTSRRRLLRLGGLALTASLAGCGTVPGLGGDASPYTRVYRDTIQSVFLVDTGDEDGTGFVYDDTHIATNAHVVGEATDVDLRSSEGRWHSGRVVGTDPHSDLAVIETETLPDAAVPLPLAEDPATIGQKVVAIGNPFDLDGSVTTGIVSGTDRSIRAPTGYSIPDAIQTDAAVNPGNSGGPLMALDGTVLAVINSGGGDNIAFGVSAALARRVLPELVDTGTFKHSFLGLSLITVTPEIATANGLDRPRGLLVVSVAPNGPSAGVLTPTSNSTTVNGEQVPVDGDVLLEIDGVPTDTTESLGSYLALETRPGDTVSLTILRDGTERTVDVELGTRPAQRTADTRSRHEPIRISHLALTFT